MSNINSEQLAQMEEKLAKLKMKKEDAETPQQRFDAMAQIKELEAKMKALYKEGQLPNAPAGMKVGGMAKKFPCAGCPTPSACSAAGKCARSPSAYSKGGAVKKYAKGGYVNCGASMKPAQKGTK